MMVPAGYHEVLPAESPIKGDLGAIDQAATLSGDVSHDCVSYSAQLVAASAQLAGGRGASLQKYQLKLDETLQRGASQMKESADTAKAGFIGYSSEVESIHKRARTVRDNIDDHLAVIRSEAAIIESICVKICSPLAPSWQAPPSVVMPAPQLDPSRSTGMDAAEQGAVLQTLTRAYETEWQRAVLSWVGAVEGVQAERDTWAKLLEERRAAESALLNTLHDTTLGQLISLGSGPGGPGPKFTIAHTISGELWGHEVAPRSPAQSHPDLSGLLPGGDGTGIWDSPPQPETVAAWWSALAQEVRDRLIAEVPWVIGNLPGLPYGVRDAANRLMLDFYADNPSTLSPEQLKVAAELQFMLQREAEQQRLFGSPRPPIQVVGLDLTSSVPRTAVGYGDSDTATDTTWAGPGMESDAHLAVEVWDEAARNLIKAQSDLLGGQGSSSVIVYLGYDSPDLVDSLNPTGVLNSAAASAGAVRFAAELDGNHAARAAGGYGVPAINVIAHSYGTTLVTIALTLVDYPVNSLTLIASAGLDLERVPNYAALNVAELSPGQQAIYTTHAAADLLAPSGAALAGRGQPNPGAVGVLGLQQFSPVYDGGLAFSSDGDAQRELLPTDGHSVIGEGERRGFAGTSASDGHGYFDRGTQSLDGIAQITAGRVSPEFADALVRTEAACPQLFVGPRGALTIERTECR